MRTRASAAVLFVGAVVVMTAQAPQTPPAGPGPGGAAAPGGGGRGGGIGAVAAALFTEKCAGCHGTDLAGGRAASLFDQKVLARLDDDRLARIIRAGLPAAGMPAFDDLTEEQIGQLIHHIRAETGNLAPKPAFIANPAGHILKTEKQTVKAELVADGLETPWGLAFLPDGRLLVTERRAIFELSTRALIRAGEGHAESARSAGWRNARCRGAPGLCEERLDLPRVFGGASGFYAAGARTSSGSCRAARSRSRAADTVDDGHRPREAQHEQRVDRRTADLPRATGDLYAPLARTSGCASFSIVRGTSFIPSASAVSFRTRRISRTRWGRSTA